MFKLSIWYAATPEGEPPQTHELTAVEVEEFVLQSQVGFIHDMLSLKGEGVRKLMLEVKEETT